LDRLATKAQNSELIELVETLLDRWEVERDEADRRLRRLSDNLQALDNRLLTVENSRIFRSLQRVTRSLRGWRTRGKHYVIPEGEDASQRRAYQLWLERERLGMPPPGWYKDELAAFEYQPQFSALLRIDRPQLEQLKVAIESIRSQSYPYWELCVCDDASPEPWVGEYFEHLSSADARIHYVRSEQPMGAASSLNRASMLAGGDYFAVLDAESCLSNHALFYLVRALQQKRFDLLYADEDRLNGDGTRERPVFKPSWSPDLLLGSMFLGRFLAISRTVLDQTGWFRADFGGALLYDLVLRLAEQPIAVKHIPLVLSSSPQVEPDRKASKQALEAAIHRRGWHAVVEDPDGQSFQVRRKLNGTPLASIIICSRKANLLRNCLRTTDNVTAYPVRETVVIQHKTGDDQAMDRLLDRSHCIRISHAGPFDFAAMNNRGAEAANGEVLVFLNDDVEPLTADWLKELLVQLQRPEVGVVGARLLYPSGAIQHAGIALGLMDGAGHPHRGTFGQGFWRWSGFTRNVTAVTGACLAIRRAVFEELGGFDTHFPVNYNDVDLCLRARQAGYEVLCVASATLRHQESKTRMQGVSWQERERFFDRWGKLIDEGDPYYSPHLARTREDCSLGHG
jgi:GT2 family glycosyltransferase